MIGAVSLSVRGCTVNLAIAAQVPRLDRTVAVKLEWERWGLLCPIMSGFLCVLTSRREDSSLLSVHSPLINVGCEKDGNAASCWLRVSTDSAVRGTRITSCGKPTVRSASRRPRRRDIN